MIRRSKRSIDRAKAEFARKYRSREYVFYLQVAMGCCVCGKRAEAAHLGNEGLGRKSGWKRLVPLCPHHHRLGRFSLDQTSQEAFQIATGVDLDVVATRCQEAFDSEQGQLYIRMAKDDGRFDEWRHQ